MPPCLRASVLCLRGGFLLSSAFLLISCSNTPPETPPPVTASWRPIASFSGRGSSQTGTFLIESSPWRVHWEATNESAPGAGRLKVTTHSGDSGRLLEQVVDGRGAGRGTTDMHEHPRRYYFVVESANVDWKLSVEEPVIDRRR